MKSLVVLYIFNVMVFHFPDSVSTQHQKKAEMKGQECQNSIDIRCPSKGRIESSEPSTRKSSKLTNIATKSEHTIKSISRNIVPTAWEYLFVNSPHTASKLEQETELKSSSSGTGSEHISPSTSPSMATILSDANPSILPNIVPKAWEYIFASSPNAVSKLDQNNMLKSQNTLMKSKHKSQTNLPEIVPKHPDNSVATSTNNDTNLLHMTSLQLQNTATKANQINNNALNFEQSDPTIPSNIAPTDDKQRFVKDIDGSTVNSKVSKNTIPLSHTLKEHFVQPSKPKANQLRISYPNDIKENMASLRPLSHTSSGSSNILNKTPFIDAEASNADAVVDNPILNRHTSKQEMTAKVNKLNAKQNRDNKQSAVFNEQEHSAPLVKSSVMIAKHITKSTESQTTDKPEISASVNRHNAKQNRDNKQSAVFNKQEHNTPLVKSSVIVAKHISKPIESQTTAEQPIAILSIPTVNISSDESKLLSRLFDTILHTAPNPKRLHISTGKGQHTIEDMAKMESSSSLYNILKHVQLKNRDNDGSELQNARFPLIATDNRIINKHDSTQSNKWIVENGKTAVNANDVTKDILGVESESHTKQQDLGNPKTMKTDHLEEFTIVKSPTSANDWAKRFLELLSSNQIDLSAEDVVFIMEHSLNHSVTLDVLFKRYTSNNPKLSVLYQQYKPAMLKLMNVLQILSFESEHKEQVADMFMNYFDIFKNLSDKETKTTEIPNSKSSSLNMESKIIRKSTIGNINNINAATEVSKSATHTGGTRNNSENTTSLINADTERNSVVQTVDNVERNAVSDINEKVLTEAKDFVQQTNSKANEANIPTIKTVKYDVLQEEIEALTQAFESSIEGKHNTVKNFDFKEEEEFKDNVNNFIKDVLDYKEHEILNDNINISVENKNDLEENWDHEDIQEEPLNGIVDEDVEEDSFNDIVDDDVEDSKNSDETLEHDDSNDEDVEDD